MVLPTPMLPSSMLPPLCSHSFHSYYLAPSQSAGTLKTHRHQQVSLGGALLDLGLLSLGYTDSMGRGGGRHIFKLNLN